jgi:hypothetical protein
MEGAAKTHDARRLAQLLGELASFDEGSRRPTARERLERLIGGYLARLLVGALTAQRRPRQARI